ncbi:MAG: hypothetical protein FJW40_07410 [Acidobacteria bacterium]|nr:hypothetical protein [Acidobacteriota bacterium]
MAARIVLLVGLPGSGKSTYAARRGAQSLSSDEIRRWLTGDETDQRYPRRVFSILRGVLRHRLEIGVPETYVDATNLTRRERRQYIKLGELYGASVEAVFLDVPFEVCCERNRARARVVPEDVMAMLARRLEAPSVEEGLACVARVVGDGSSL